MLEGIYKHTIDAKGRLFIPADLRDKLGDSFRVTLGYPHAELKKECLAAFPNETWDKIAAKYDAMPRREKIKMRQIFAHSKPYELDSQGRILLPQNVRDRAELKKNVTIVGAGDNVEIWDADVWDKIYELESTLENIASIYDELDF